MLTFHHEPSNDGSDAQGKHWAAAYCHIHDLLKAEGALQNVADPPILGDWLFNPRNSQDPAEWADQGRPQRMPFLGIDMYENTSGETLADRIPEIIGWMAQQGFPNKMVGIGETGATDMYKARRHDRRTVDQRVDVLGRCQHRQGRRGVVLQLRWRTRAAASTGRSTSRRPR